MSSDWNEIVIELLKKVKPYEEINNKTELIDTGILDSLSVIAIVTQLENRFEIEVPDDAITAKNFSNVENIIKMLEKYSVHTE